MAKQISPETKRILDEAHDWLSLLDDPKMSGADRVRFEAWLKTDPNHGRLYHHAKASRAAFQSLKPSDIREPLRYTPVRAVKLILGDVMDVISFHRRWSLGVGGAVAAALVLVIFLMPQAPVPGTAPAPVIAAYESDVGELKSLTLGDGTTVTLGARSAIETRFFEDRRVVALKAGVAYFHVVSDETRPFTVKAGELTATALGTQFDVRSNGGVYRVGVSEGKVQVGYPLIVSGKRMGMITRRDLVAGQYIAATDTGGLDEVSEVDLKYVAAWRRDRLIYGGVSITELVADLNRYSDVPIVMDGPPDAFSGLRFRGVFRQPDIDDVLETLSAVHPIDVDRSNADWIALRLRDSH